jgi:drug/metabolite transporter (DMT)-like permease
VTAPAPTPASRPGPADPGASDPFARDRPAPGAPPFPPRLGLAAAVFAISWAAILIRWADAPPLVTGAWRLAIASLAFWAAALASRRFPWRGWTAGRLATALAAAVFLALHFGLWIASLGLTTVASSVLLVSTQPVFTAALGALLLRERVGTRAAAGIAVALAGSLAITGGDLRVAGTAWRGDLLALAGAVAIAAHYLLVRSLRPTTDLLPLLAVFNPVAAGLLFAAAAFAGEPLVDHPPRTMAVFVLLALVPTVIGHTLLNWALRYRKAYEVNVTVLGEPLGATALAWLLLGETPGAHVAAGGALVLAGILLAWSGPRRTAAGAGGAAR